MSQTTENLLPAVTGQDLGSSTQQWDAFIQNLTLYSQLLAKNISGIKIADPAHYATIQAAITDAGTTGAVIIPPNWTGSDSYTNANTIQILDFRPTLAQQFVFEGDSITAGTGLSAGQDWPSQAMLLPWFKSRGTKTNVATTGATISTLTSRYAASVYPLRPASASSYPRSYLFVDVGINDIGAGTAASTIFSNINTYWSTASTDGFKVVAFTIYKTTTLTAAQVAQLESLNNLIRTATTWDYLIDVDALMSGRSTDANFFQGDFVHPTAAGAKLIARTVNAAMNSEGEFPLFVKGYDLACGTGQTVGVGTQAPFKTFQVDFKSTNTTPANGECQILAYNPDTTASNMSAYGFGTGYASTSQLIARIAAVGTSTGSSLYFYTTSNYATNPAVAALILDKNGSATIGTKIVSYNGVATVAGGVPAAVAAVDLTAQNAAVGTTTLYAVPSAGAGQYRLVWNAKITTAATTGAATSTLGALTIVYTDPDGVAVTLTSAAVIAAGTVATTSTANTTGTVLVGIPQMLNCKASTNITYAMAYASNTAAEMKYNLHIALERL